MTRFVVTVTESVAVNLTVDCPDAETLEKWIDSEDFADAVSEHTGRQVVEDRDWGYTDSTGDDIPDSEVDYVVKEGERCTVSVRKWRGGD